jgi:hypothetical protein
MHCRAAAGTQPAELITSGRSALATAVGLARLADQACSTASGVFRQFGKGHMRGAGT